jgi:hypothetical protein
VHGDGQGILYYHHVDAGSADPGSELDPEVLGHVFEAGDQPWWLFGAPKDHVADGLRLRVAEVELWNQGGVGRIILQLASTVVDLVAQALSYLSPLLGFQ